MIQIGYPGAALAGLLSFLSPCILPMVPFYLSYLAGLSIGDLRAGRAARRQLVVRAMAFALGVTTIFVGLGMGASAMGSLLAQWYRPLSWLAAAVLALFGLHVLGVLRIPVLNRQTTPRPVSAPSTLMGGYGMGLAFGFGWTPCVGPALAAILLVAGGMGDPVRGGMLLLVYGMAMTLPFVLIAACAGPALAWLARHRTILRGAEVAMGLMLIAFAVLIATDSVSLIAAWMLRRFDWSATLT